MDENDMIYSRREDGIYAGGYRFNNEFINKETGPFTIMQQGGSSEMLLGTALQNLAVPTGLLFLQQNISSNTNLEKSLNIVKDDLYDTLVDLMSNEKQNKRNTRKRKLSKNKKTRRRK